MTAGWVIGSQADHYTMAVLERLQDGKAVVPSIWLYEVANMLLSAEIKKFITREESSAFYKMLKGLSFEIIHKNDEAWSELLLWMSKTHHLTAYDTAYLYLAMDRGYPLATRDLKLESAAKMAGVEIFQP
ncbi:MAG: type II toxin-antitoxin system VapC family toxin [Deltaproteobacteria bacterium]|nr:type II toxin-antitoxin system VapC family toxin [Deltaproteobacteria bacterium]